MHRFSWRMATVQMRLMLHREYVGRSECVYHHALFIQPNMTPLICLLKLCDHTFCRPMTHLPFLRLCVRPSNVCRAFTCYLSQSCRLCVYIQCVYRAADRALTPLSSKPPSSVAPSTFTRAASPHLKLQPRS